MGLLARDYVKSLNSMSNISGHQYPWKMGKIDGKWTFPEKNLLLNKSGLRFEKLCYSITRIA